MGTPNPGGGSKLQSNENARVTPFGKYLLMERVAAGGMAEVFRAKQAGASGFQKVMAIKRILPQVAEDRDFIEMFIDEAKITGQLTHPNICPIYELGKIGEIHYIALEYVWGKDLLQIINRFRKQRKTMPHDMVAYIGAQMSEGLEYAHKKLDRQGKPLGIIHRDVSPQNVLVSYEGGVRVIDFGIAKAASRSTATQAGVLKGKFGYMSPEQVRGLPIDHRSDVFAVGTCLWELATCDRLFLGESDFATLERVRHATVPKIRATVPGFPEELEKIILKALARDPIDRWQNAGDLQDALQRYLASLQPPYSPAKLSAWMHSAFEPEMTQESARQKAFEGAANDWVSTSSGSFKLTPSGRPPASRVTRMPSQKQEVLHVPAAYDDPFAGLPTTDDEEEATLAAMNFADLAPSSDFDEGNEQATQIFFSADEFDIMPAASSSEPPTMAKPMDDLFGAPPTKTPPRRGSTPNVPRRPSQANMPAAQLEASPAGGTTDDAMSFPRPPQSIPPHIVPYRGPAPDMTEKLQAIAPEPPAWRRYVVFAVVAVFLISVGALLPFALRSFMSPSQAVGSVDVITRPVVVGQLFVDGTLRGATPVKLENLTAGAHRVRIVAQGYEPFEREVQIQANGSSTLNAELVAVPSPAPTPPAVAPQPAPTPPAARANEATGTPAVAPEAPRAPTATATATPTTATTAPASAPSPPATAPIAAPRTPAADNPPANPAPATTNTPARPAATPVRAPAPASAQTAGPPVRAGTGAATGPTSITISTQPWARIFIDGRDTGRNTPARDIPITPGRHVIRLVTADSRTLEEIVEIQPGEHARLVREIQ